MNSIHILHVTRTLDPGEGLQPRLAVRIAAEQAEAGHHVTLLTMDNASVMLHAQREYGHLAGYQRLHIHHSHEPFGFSYLFGNSAIQWMQPIVSRLAIIHLHGMWEALLRRAAKLGRMHGVPVVVTPHPRQGAYAPRFARPLLNLIMRASWSGLLRRAAMVHVMDDEDERRLKAMGLRENLYHVPDGLEMTERVTHSYPLGGKLPKAVVCALAARSA